MASPYQTIKKAGDLTNPGDTVYVMNGTYTVANSVIYDIHRSGTAGRPITYGAYPGQSPKIFFNNAYGFQIETNVSYIVINGFEIMGNDLYVTIAYAQAQTAWNPACDGVGIYAAGPSAPGTTRPHHLTITNNYIHNCGGAGIGLQQCDYVTITGNTVTDNCWDTIYANSGISLYQFGDIDTNTGYKNIIANNFLCDNICYVKWIALGIFSDGNGIIIDDFKNTQNGSTLGVYGGRTLIENNISIDNGGSGIHTYSSEHVDTFNNTAYMNSQKVAYAEIDATSSGDCKVENNIMYAKGTSSNADDNTGSTGVTFDYNIYYNCATPLALGTHDLLANPLFVAPSANETPSDFQLMAGSPAIGSGTSVGTSFNRGACNGPPPVATLNVPYSFTYASASIGYPTPVFSVASGALPIGLTLSNTGVISGTPAVSGTYTGTVSAGNGIAPPATQNFSITILTTFSAWASEYGGGPSISDPNAIPESDGVVNLNKYLFDINPIEVMSATDRAALPAVGMSTTGGIHYLTLTYRQYAGISGISVNVQTSADLRTWTTLTLTTTIPTPATYTLQQVSTDLNTGDPIMQVQVPSIGTREFIRLNVTQP